MFSHANGKSHEVHSANDHRFAIVLAGGEGKRLQTITCDDHGRPVPKQFCSLAGGESLLRSTLERAQRSVPSDRVVTVVAEQHARWWGPDLADLPARDVVVQPRPRGTAPGVLLPLLEVLSRDPAAVVAVLPADHYVEDEDVLDRSLDAAFAGARESGTTVLLGMCPDGPETQYGWIVPADLPRPGLRRVASFVEKPEHARAVDLMERGALWNSFILVAPGRGLLGLYAERCPELLARFLACDGGRERGSRSVEALYETLPDTDFSRALLERAPASLRVLEVSPCGWTDLGTPERVARCLASLGDPGFRVAAGRPAPGPDLAESLGRSRFAEGAYVARAT